MIPPTFDYVRVSTVDEAVATLVERGEDAKVLAGGQSLMPLLRLRLAYPSVLVDVGRVDDLRGVREDGQTLAIGAMTTHHEVLNNPLVRQHCPLLTQTTGTVADPAVRHRGTFGGSLAHADPAGDLPAAALATDAELVVAGPGGRRSIPAAEFFRDYLETALGADELLVEVRVPRFGPEWGSHYEKFHRVAQAWAIVGVVEGFARPALDVRGRPRVADAAAMVRAADGVIAEARIGLTNMGPTPVRATAAEQALVGVSVTDTAGIQAACQQAAEGTNPAADLSAQPDYRRHLARVLTARAVSRAIEATGSR